MSSCVIGHMLLWFWSDHSSRVVVKTLCEANALIPSYRLLSQAAVLSTTCKSISQLRIKSFKTFSLTSSISFEKSSQSSWGAIGCTSEKKRFYSAATSSERSYSFYILFSSRNCQKQLLSTVIIFLGSNESLFYYN